jgi:hypothetical protein
VNVGTLLPPAARLKLDAHNGSDRATERHQEMTAVKLTHATATWIDVSSLQISSGLGLVLELPSVRLIPIFDLARPVPGGAVCHAG